MSTPLDAVAVRTYKTSSGEERKQYTNLGKAWPFRDGKPGYTVKLSAIPAPVDGEYVIMLFEPREKDGSSGGGASRRPSAASSGGGFSAGGMDDNIPFLPETRG